MLGGVGVAIADGQRALDRPWKSCAPSIPRSANNDGGRMYLDTRPDDFLIVGVEIVDRHLTRPAVDLAYDGRLFLVGPSGIGDHDQSSADAVQAPAMPTPVLAVKVDVSCAENISSLKLTVVVADADAHALVKRSHIPDVAPRDVR